MKTNFTKVGKAHTQGLESEWESAFNQIAWKGPQERLSFSGGFALQKMAEDLPGRKVLAVADYQGIAYPSRFGLLAIRKQFSNCAAEIYALDDGSNLTIIATRPIYAQPAKE